MCIAILKPKGVRNVTQEEFSECWRCNKDGFGCMYQLTEKGKTATKFYKTMDREKALAFFDDVQSKKNVGDIAFHFRIATHGTVDINMCHPFNAGHGFFMMHNGMLGLKDPFGKKSDTCILAEMLAMQEFNWWADAEKMEKLSEFARGSKLIFMDEEQSFIVNEKSGHWWDGIWWSNYSYMKYEAPKKTEPYKVWNEPYKGSRSYTYDSNNKSLILPMTPEEQIKQNKKIAEIQEWTQYKSSIQGLLSREQREELNLLTMEETNWYWIAFTGNDKLTVQQKKERIQEFYEYVMTVESLYPVEST